MRGYEGARLHLLLFRGTLYGVRLSGELDTPRCRSLYRFPLNCPPEALLFWVLLDCCLLVDDELRVEEVLPADEALQDEPLPDVEVL